MNTENDQNDLVELTTEIVSAFASRNQMSSGELPDLIRTVHAALGGLDNGAPAAAQDAPAEIAATAPAVPIDASVSDDAVTCLECGKSFKTLKRHLSTEHGMDPAGYRARWQLSKDYPLVAPSYSRRRAKTAKDIGLGQRGGRKKG